MKKSLLFVCAVTMTFCANAQNRKASVIPSFGNFGRQNCIAGETSNNSNLNNYVVKNNPSVGTNAITDIPLGYA